MRLTFDQQLTTSYKSASQRARVFTEQWVADSIFCPNCGHLNINKHPNNSPASDFYCLKCKEEYELKSKKNKIGVKVVDGAYHTMLERLKSSNNPNLFLLEYNLSVFQITNFLVIPRYFFVPKIIERRKPLSPTARRAGWVGCNILLQSIPKTGRIFFIKDKQIAPKEKVLAEWQKTLFLREERDIFAKGWLLDTIKSIEQVGKREFTLSEVYAFEKRLSELHPENKHIKDKIRQQLQILRDKNYLEFSNRGTYRLI